MTKVSDCGVGSAQLGEGLFWHAPKATLYWVDIHGMQVFAWGLNSQPVCHVLDQRVGWVIPDESGEKLYLGLQAGVALAPVSDPTRYTLIHDLFAGNAALRLNDAKADATGAIWAGSLNNDDESRSDGVLFRVVPGVGFTVCDTGYTVANGPAIHPNGKVLFHTDSGRRTIYRFDLDVSTGQLTNKTVWKIFSDDEGYPDGMTFDADGALWVAHWGGACVSRFDVDGRLLARIAIPAPHVTNVCFAGHGLSRLFVTTARAGLDARQLQEYPQSGCVFEILGHGVTGIAGQPARTILPD